MAWDRKQRRKLSDAGSWAFVSSNLSFVFFIVLAAGIMIASRAQVAVFDSAREVVNDATMPMYEMLAAPAGMLKRWGQGLDSFLSVYEENQKLREENARLLAKQSQLAELERKVDRYEELLKAQTDPTVTSVAARVIADASGPFIHTVLVNAGRTQGIAKGQAVVDELGLIGRVVTSGNRSARVLLLTDLNSRIPVMIEGVNLKAILAGDNSLRPSLEYLPPGAKVPIGARVVTTPDGGVFPPGVPVGTIAADSKTPRVDLFTGESRADFVRILSYTAEVDVNNASPEPLPGAVGAVPEPAQVTPSAPAAAPAPPPAARPAPTTARPSPAAAMPAAAPVAAAPAVRKPKRPKPPAPPQAAPAQQEAAPAAPAPAPGEPLVVRSQPVPD